MLYQIIHSFIFINGKSQMKWQRSEQEEIAQQNIFVIS
jgi:hypothetical protein